MSVVHDIYTKKFLLLLSLGCFLIGQSMAQFRVSGSVGNTPNSVCINESTNPSVQPCNEPAMFFDDQAPAGTTAWSWNFGDINSGLNNISTLQNPRHQYTKTGTYPVLLTRTVLGVPQPPAVVNLQVRRYTRTSKPLFNKKEKADTTVCSGANLKLDPFNLFQGNTVPSNVSYLWSPKGQTTPTLDVTESGCYSVEVTDNATGCKKMAQITVKFCLQPAPAGGGLEKFYVGDKAAFSIITSQKPLPRDTIAKENDLFNPKTEDDKTSVVSQPGNPMNTVNATAMVYSPKGEIAFTTDGKTIYNRQDQPIGTISSGSVSATTPALIVPKYTCNECPHVQYYVLSYDETRKTLSYSIVDTRLNGGNGAISEKDVPMATNLSEKITYGYTDDKSGMYIIMHENGNNTYRVMKIDSNGISSDKTFNMGQVWDTQQSQSGYIRMSLRGNRIISAVTKGGQNYVEVYNFAVDPSTGEPQMTLYKTINLGAAPPTVYGIEISPSEDLIYVTINGTGQSRLIQINIETLKQNIIYSSASPLGDIRLMPIGSIEAIGQTEHRLVVAVPGSNEIIYLMNPDTEGGKDFVNLNNGNNTGGDIGGKMGWGLSNVVKAKEDSQNDGIQVTYRGNCERGTTIFTLQAVCSPMKTKAVWDFGDGSPTQEGLTVTHVYEKAGKYNIKLIITISEDVVKRDLGQISTIINKVFRDECRQVEFNDLMYVLPGPELKLPDPIYVCTALFQSKVLDANPNRKPNYAYLWEFGTRKDTSRTILVDAPFRRAKITVQNQYDCKVEKVFDILDKCDPVVLVPNTFTPNGDSTHETFKIDARFVVDYELSIFNRWGELIFNTTKPDTYWDGSYKNNGKPNQTYGPLTYAYVIKYRSEDFPERGIETKRGAVMVLK
jgi:gliding motility-associated-like protein